MGHAYCECLRPTAVSVWVLDASRGGASEGDAACSREWYERRVISGAPRGSGKSSLDIGVNSCIPDSANHVNIRVLQTMVSGIPLALGSRTRM